jgi:hypothetical protein
LPVHAARLDCQLFEDAPGPDWCNQPAVPGHVNGGAPTMKILILVALIVGVVIYLRSKA